tara:strand:- start:59 stop:394 length:336 start_codon:yes stop_codon:yes gene_type:complete
MILDHEAIRKAYPDAAIISDDTGAWKADGVTKITLDQSKIDAARVTLNSEAAAIQYQKERKGTKDSTSTTNYASIGDQLDMLYADLVAGKLDATGTWATHIKNVKDKNPKP